MTFSSLDLGPSVAYKTKKVLENPKFDEVLRITGSGITLTNNEIKDTAKVIRSLENGRSLLKGTTIKTISQEG